MNSGGHPYVVVVVVGEITDRFDPCSNKLVKSYSIGPSPMPPTVSVSGCKLLAAPSNSLLSLASIDDDVEVVDDAILVIAASCRILFASEFFCCLWWRGWWSPPIPFVVDATTTALVARKLATVIPRAVDSCIIILIQLWLDGRYFAADDIINAPLVLRGW